AAHGDDARLTSWQARARRTEATVQWLTADIPAAMRSLHEALMLATAAAARDPANRRPEVEPEAADGDFADAQAIAGGPRAAIDAARAARDLAAELARADPTNRAQAADLGERETIVCKAQRAHHELGAAIASCRAAVDAFAELIAFEPRNASWQTALMS